MREVTKNRNGPASQLAGNHGVNTRIIAAIPCFNNEKSIADVVVRTKKYVDEVIVIDDGSTDNTAKLAKNAGAGVLSHVVNKGYGEAIKSCFKVAQSNGADILVTIDGDGQHNPDEIQQVLNPIISEGAGLVIGSRFLNKNQEIPRYRKFGIRVITSVWNFGSKTKVTDAQSGFRAYSKEVIEKMNLSEKGMSVSIEILEKIRRNRWKIKEIPITCSYENNNSSLSKKAFWHGFSVAIAVLKIRIKYGLAMR